jgi:TolB-like protein
MKKTNLGFCLTIGFVLLCAGTLGAQQQGQLSLDDTITQAAKAVEEGLSAGAKLAVLNFSSSSEAFSDYVIEELSGALVMNKKVTVIERRSLDLIRNEMNLHLSGDVSDESAMSIGKQLGAQGIVTGSLTNLGNVYRFRIKVINVETARIETQLSYNMGNDPQVAFLLHGDQQGAPAAPAKTPSSGAGSKTPAPAASNTPVPQTVTYVVGKTGPAGGLVFYDKGSFSDGWRYLEAAPASTEKQVAWGASGVTIGRTGTEIGTGKANTARINNRRAEPCGIFNLHALF